MLKQKIIFILNQKCFFRFFLKKPLFCALSEAEMYRKAKKQLFFSINFRAERFQKPVSSDKKIQERLLFYFGIVCCSLSPNFTSPIS
jgi:hypothetical protein